MWLINTHTFTLEFVPDSHRQNYAILLHIWGEDEVLFKDMNDIGHARLKKGWRKIQETCRLARERSLPYAWIDTCCIDKSSSAELSEAINSMFDWYQGAVRLETICRKTDHRKAIQDKRSAGVNNHDGAIAVAFDYAFQYMKDPFKDGDGDCEEGSIALESLITDEGGGLTPRFTVNGVSTTEIIDRPGGRAGYRGSDELTLRYERIERQANIPTRSTNNCERVRGIRNGPYAILTGTTTRNPA
ncbi:hypothetical protein GE09DRAFT_1250055 [Coniochaeta sp. 2T2.1]|nr:hypothetical protein GE09DRAFT_1250055 [Coniochaeta sp. 2T2.1]